MATKADFYEVLGVTRTADEARSYASGTTGSSYGSGNSGGSFGSGSTPGNTGSDFGRS